MPHKDPEARRVWQRSYRKANLEKKRAYHKEYQKKWRAEHPGIYADKTKEWWDNNPEKKAAYEAKRKAAPDYRPNKHARDQQRHKRRYGLSLERYAELEKYQGGVCAICKKPETAKHHNGLKTNRLAIDHCHNSKNIRGLLCTRCNLGIGCFSHDLQLLLNAVAYLMEPPASRVP